LVLWHAVSTKLLQLDVWSLMRSVDGHTDMLHSVSVTAEASCYQDIPA